jgi:hypothetical protein
MNALVRIITGLVVIVLSVSFILSVGFFDGPGIDYIAVIVGFFFFLVGVLILFNKREDEIEKIKKRK